MIKMVSGLGGNAGAVLAGAAAATALAVGAYVGFGREQAAQAPEGQAAVQTTPEQPAQQTEAAVIEPAPQDTTPAFDELRREADGTTVIAGRAAPLSDVSILLDGVEVATATADSNGGFAAVASLPPNEAAQVVSLEARIEEEVTASLDEIILAPSAVQPPAETQPDAPAQTGQTATPEVPDTPRVAVLKSDAEGVELLNPEVTDDLGNIALDTIGYSQEGAVRLTGRAQRDTASVRVYLDNRSIIDLPVGSDGTWRGDLPQVDEGVYTLRVDEVAQSGAVSSRVETPFKRESAAVLAQASADAQGPITSITVQTGATLWAIARDRYGDGTLFVRVLEANADSIRDPDLIYPGQVFDLPN